MGAGLSESDTVLVQRQQQQDGPAAQQAHVVQQEEEPGSTVPHVQHGRELKRSGLGSTARSVPLLRSPPQGRPAILTMSQSAT